ncbi:MAG: F0F1 ATP synthase subunit A, partial [Flavobacteriales bacterium]|nr:F0F1 ATP synthase subunit A [Flavobacteriales bacterium]
MYYAIPKLVDKDSMEIVNEINDNATITPSEIKLLWSDLEEKKTKLGYKAKTTTIFPDTVSTTFSAHEGHGHASGTDHMGGELIIPLDAKFVNLKPWDFSLTKNVVFILLVAFLMFLMFSRMARNYKKGPMPKRMGRFLEPIIIYVRDDIAIPNIGVKHYKKYMSYLLTVFFFVWII